MTTIFLFVFLLFFVQLINEFVLFDSQQIITLMLEKLHPPLQGCIEVLNRITVLLEMDPVVPPTSRQQGPEQAQLLFYTLNKVREKNKQNKTK